MSSTDHAHRIAVSADGTPVAYEVFGAGPTLVTVCGATADRALLRPAAEAFGRHFRTVAYDRRGRGDSGDTPPYTVDREIEDLAAVIAEVGDGPVHLYGHSSGAGLALRAVAAGLPVERLVLHEPPYSPEDPAAQEEPAPGPGTSSTCSTVGSTPRPSLSSSVAPWRPRRSSSR